jgi:hypothetical protein
LNAKSKSLREWLSEQSVPPDQQAKLEELFRLPDKWAVNFGGSNLDSAEELEKILDE